MAVIPVLSQTPVAPKPSFDVISIKPTVPNARGAIRIGGGTPGDRFSVSGVTLRMLLQNGYSNTQMGSQLVGQLQIIGEPNWIDLDRYDIQATFDCRGGVLSRDQIQLMVQSMLESRFQLKAHEETRELPIYNLVVAKDGPKIKASADQTPLASTPGGPPQPCSPSPATPAAPFPPPPAPGQRGGTDPKSVMPRGAMAVSTPPTSTNTLRASAVPLGNLIAILQQQVGRPIIDKTALTGLFDFMLQFSPEGLSSPGVLGGTANPQSTPSDPVSAVLRR